MESDTTPFSFRTKKEILFVAVSIRKDKIRKEKILGEMNAVKKAL